MKLLASLWFVASTVSLVTTVCAETPAPRGQQTVVTAAASSYEEDQRSFASACKVLEQFAADLNTTLWIEGLPLPQRIVAASQNPPTDTSRASLEKFASALGYKMVEKDGVLLLLKNTQLASDLPPVSLAEANFTLQQLRLLISQVDVPSGLPAASDTPHNRIIRLARLLRTIDTSMLAHGVPARSLSQEQQQAFRSVIYLSRYGDKIDILNRVQQDLDSALRPTTAYSDNLHTAAPQVSFGYQEVFTATQPHSLNNPDARYINHATLYTPLMGYGQTAYDPGVVRAWMGQTRPDANSRRSIAFEQYLRGTKAPAGVTTIKAAVEQLSSSQEAITIAPPFGDEPLLVFGLRRSSTVHNLTALTELSGLRLVRQADKQTSTVVSILLPPLPLQPGQIETVAKNVALLLPPSLQRYTTASEDEPQAVNVTEPLSSVQRFQARIRKEEKERNAQTLRAVQRRIAVVKQLRTLLEPVFAAAGGEEIEASKLPLEARRMLGLLALLDTVDAVGPLMREAVPESLTKFDSFYVFVRETAGDSSVAPDSSWYRVILGTPAPEGQVWLECEYGAAIPQSPN